MSGISTNEFTPNKYLNYLPTKTQNKNYSYFPIFGHTFLCPFFKSATTFFSEKTQKTTSEHNAAKRDFPRFYLLLNFFFILFEKGFRNLLCKYYILTNDLQ